MEPAFLTLAEVLEIHRDQIERYGGEPGIRDIGLLKSAIGMPAAAFGDEFLHTDVFEMGAAYLFHLAQNHPFVDGNKRVGIVAALVFFTLNRIDIQASDTEIEEMVFTVARSELAKSEIAEFFRKRAAAG